MARRSDAEQQRAEANKQRKEELQKKKKSFLPAKKWTKETKRRHAEIDDLLKEDPAAINYYDGVDMFIKGTGYIEKKLGDAVKYYSVNKKLTARHLGDMMDAGYYVSKIIG